MLNLYLHAQEQDTVVTLTSYWISTANYCLSRVSPLIIIHDARTHTLPVSGRRPRKAGHAGPLLCLERSTVAAEGTGLFASRRFDQRIRLSRLIFSDVNFSRTLAKRNRHFATSETICDSVGGRAIISRRRRASGHREYARAIYRTRKIAAIIGNLCSTRCGNIIIIDSAPLPSPMFEQSTTCWHYKVVPWPPRRTTSRNLNLAHVYSW